mmetsp:Transcript_32167/g.99625  ORF Transcript_32167/g.99625 Transcript_32167/m.99625 type:complete len:229 (-) Transcript_32167:18-704(-)
MCVPGNSRKTRRTPSRGASVHLLGVRRRLEMGQQVAHAVGVLGRELVGLRRVDQLPGLLPHRAAALQLLDAVLARLLLVPVRLLAGRDVLLAALLLVGAVRRRLLAHHRDAVVVAAVHVGHPLRGGLRLGVGLRLALGEHGGLRRLHRLLRRGALRRARRAADAEARDTVDAAAAGRERRGRVLRRGAVLRRAGGEGVLVARRGRHGRHVVEEVSHGVFRLWSLGVTQ